MKIADLVPGKVYLIKGAGRVEFARLGETGCAVFYKLGGSSIQDCLILYPSQVSVFVTEDPSTPRWTYERDSVDGPDDSCWWYWRLLKGGVTVGRIFENHEEDARAICEAMNARVSQ